MIDNITPVVLVKDDAYFLPYCLESVAGRFSKMVIYDVGSTDGTTDIINWYTDKEKSRTEFTVRLLPACPPSVQGTFRNAMIAEARNDVYFILDADEIYRPRDLDAMGDIILPDERRIYGVFTRIEVGKDLKNRYDEERTHHRLYHRRAIWTGTHPGEVPAYKQKKDINEVHYRFIKCLHMHNAIRSPMDADVPKRAVRKSQHTYHPGKLTPFNILEEYPLLQKPIANFAVCPDLEKLQNEWNKN